MNTKEIDENKPITNSFYSKFMKRFLDICLSFFLIVLLLPLFLIVWLLTIIFLGYPAIYKQVRPGKNHKTFTIFKFRSMSNKKDKEGNLLPDAQRITKFGKFLRKTSLDEIPQLFNILCGHMSFVGPRPKLVKDIIFYDKEVYDTYVLRPGLTGLAQVMGRNDNSWEMCFKQDKIYTQNVTFSNDVKIFFKTFTSIFKHTGETHSNTEEDKKKIQEYYYPDYCLRTGKINEEQYYYGLNIANDLNKPKTVIEFHNEIFDKDFVHKNAPQLNNKEKESIKEVVEESNEISKDNLSNDNNKNDIENKDEK